MTQLVRAALARSRRRFRPSPAGPHGPGSGRGTRCTGRHRRHQAPGEAEAPGGAGPEGAPTPEPAVLTAADRLHADLDAALTATTRHQGNSS